MSTPAPINPAAPIPAPDVFAARAKTDLARFLMLALPLAILLCVFKIYKLEQPAFFTMACLVFAGFAISYWLPFRFKETFVILLSLAAAYVLLTPLIATLVIAVGFALFAIIRTKIAFRWRALAIVAILAVAMYFRAASTYSPLESFWPVLGAIFMFRMIVYMYDQKYSKTPPRIKEYLSYFFLIPNYYFILFPVVDYQTFRKSYFKRDIHTVAQQGVWWIFRGTTHLLLYRIVYQWQGSFSPPAYPIAVSVITKSVFAFMLYLRVSGQFHIIAGMLCLFGYDVPETNRKYFLARGINDLWRRINIYWKDFMVKIVYFPAYFKLRKLGTPRAELLSTLLVIVVTWLLHAYQFFWLKGQFHITVTDSLFWAILGSFMLLNVWYEYKYKKRLPVPGWQNRLKEGLQVLATFSFMAMLWSLWSANSIADWLIFLRTGSEP